MQLGHPAYATALSFGPIDSGQYCPTGESRPIYSGLSFFADADRQLPLDGSRIPAGSRVWVQIMAVNCTTEVWNEKLQFAQLNAMQTEWKPALFLSPQEITSVPPYHQITVLLPVLAPQDPDAYPMTWVVTDKDSRPLNGQSTTHWLNVVSARRINFFSERSTNELMEAESELVSIGPSQGNLACSPEEDTAKLGDVRLLQLDRTTFATSEAVPIGKALWAEIAVANCTNQDWERNVRLGTVSPVDNLSWGANRIVLPKNLSKISRGQQVTIRFIARAPFQAGTHNLAWSVVRGESQWLGGLTEISVAVFFPQQSTHAICPGVDPQIRAPAGAQFLDVQLHDCIQKTPTNGVLEIAPGYYYLTRKVYVNKSLTIRTAGTKESLSNCAANAPIDCAVLIAHPLMNDGIFNTANAYNGFFFVGKFLRENQMALDNPTQPDYSVDGNFGGVTVDHLVFHGNHFHRARTPLADKMRAERHWGATAAFSWCNSCRLSHSAFINALGSTSLSWIGDDGIIINNLVRDGGQSSFADPHTRFITDGFTVLHANRLRFLNNMSFNHTDIDFIFANIKEGIVRSNVVYHELQSAIYDLHDTIGGLMLDNFNASTLIESERSLITQNFIQCNGRCSFGVQLGPYPWYPGTTGSGWASTNQTPACVKGGIVEDNVVLGAKQGLNVAGAKVTVKNNIVHDNFEAYSTMPFIGQHCASQPRSRLNYDLLISTCDSQFTGNVDAIGNALSPTTFPFRGCL